MNVMKFQKKQNEGKTSKTKDLEHSEGIEHNKKFKTNDSDKDDTRKNIA